MDIKIAGMPPDTGRKIVCGQCERPEAKCVCDKFCVLCQTDSGVRLCTDGFLYCETCRLACDYKLAEATTGSKSINESRDNDQIFSR